MESRETKGERQNGEKLRVEEKIGEGDEEQGKDKKKAEEDTRKKKEEEENEKAK